MALLGEPKECAKRDLHLQQKRHKGREQCRTINIGKSKRGETQQKTNPTTNANCKQEAKKKQSTMPNPQCCYVQTEARGNKKTMESQMSPAKKRYKDRAQCWTPTTAKSKQRREPKPKAESEQKPSPKQNQHQNWNQNANQNQNPNWFWSWFWFGFLPSRRMKEGRKRNQNQNQNQNRCFGYGFHFGKSE